MPRRSAEHKAETHDRIVSEASRTFRREGSTSSILPLMKSLGLTQGGFYRHFATKDHLFLEAIQHGYEETTARFEAAAEAAVPGHELRAIIESYLNIEHVDHPEFGCTIAALGNELDRQVPDTRKAAHALTQQFILRFCGYLPGKTHREREENFYLLFSVMVGAVTLARSIADPTSRRRIIDVNREMLIRTYSTFRQSPN